MLLKVKECVRQAANFSTTETEFATLRFLCKMHIERNMLYTAFVSEGQTMKECV
jgi:hypothetical protein